ncbi:type II secretion system protein M [Pseudomonas sp. p50]|jgi:general secretion pathway protein M|uniref:type II secretion system protein GspM n=1 Tax=Pseudomonas sp. p50(2008) TaxID=2816832 RepID=UPI00188B94DA|nr:type II secretion system protein GspM [Pseudomonas sp. p50(2008)]MBF4557034.1 type II secretion system protein M [Pseudomonas sp. p50(2008)]
MKQVWQRISVREQRLLQALGAFLLIVVAFSLIWQPTRQRLETVERQHRHQLALVAQLQHAQPRSNAPADSGQPLSLRISDNATAAGLDIHQMETDVDTVRLTLSGNANAVMQWLDGVEREGVALQSLTLEKRDALLEARVVFR